MRVTVCLLTSLLKGKVTNRVMISKMPDPRELERLGGLFNLASERNRPFLDRCSETKYLAMNDYSRATNEALKLAKQTLNSTRLDFGSGTSFDGNLTTIRNAVESGQLDGKLVKALTKLRSNYLRYVLRPAVQTYLTNDKLKTSDLETLYESALRIDGLLEVVQFLKRVKPALS